MGITTEAGDGVGEGGVVAHVVVAHVVVKVVWSLTMVEEVLCDGGSVIILVPPYPV